MEGKGQVSGHMRMSIHQGKDQTMRREGLTGRKEACTLESSAGLLSLLFIFHLSKIIIKKTKTKLPHNYLIFHFLKTTSVPLTLRFAESQLSHLVYNSGIRGQMRLTMLWGRNYSDTYKNEIYLAIYKVHFCFELFYTSLWHRFRAVRLKSYNHG